MTSNLSEFDSYLTVFPNITVLPPTKLKPKLMSKLKASNKKTKKIKKMFNSTQFQDSELEISAKNLRVFHKNSHKNIENESFPKKMKEFSSSLQIMAVFVIMFKMYTIMIKRLTNISRSFTNKDFKCIWNESMLGFTELMKYLKDLTVKTKIIKSHDAKGIALLTESFYKSIKIYENMHKKKKSYGNIIWKTFKFVPNLIKILINFDFIFPLEVFFPTSYITLFGFSLK